MKRQSKKQTLLGLIYVFIQFSMPSGKTGKFRQIFLNGYVKSQVESQTVIELFKFCLSLFCLSLLV